MAASSTESVGETLIPIVNKLQDLFAQVDLGFKLDLPQVAVVGSQSSGKSSVLEALVGRDFLPRGPDICTRRPLVLQLVKAKRGAAESQKGSEWGEFLHLPNKRFYDFNRIRAEVAAETDRVAGDDKNVCDTPIRLRIYSPHVLTMTLVDLPGIARNPVGDQPADIEARIKSMIYEYIKLPSVVILAVSAANGDLANSDALHMAQSVDPDGNRTIGVLTKIDIMDKGTDCAAVLKNQKFALRLGHIGVVNRSQHDIQTGTSMDKARATEMKFFTSNPVYRDVVPQCGVNNLARRLNSILVQHIRNLLPKLKGAINEATQERLEELKIYGDTPPGASSTQRGSLLLQILSEYCESYGSLLDGNSEAMSVNSLAGGARIRHIFQDVFVKGMTNLEPATQLTDDQIWTTIRNSSGVKGALLIPAEPFENLVKRSIKQLAAPSLQCKDYVHDELLRIAGIAAPKELMRFPALQRHLRNAVQSFIERGAEPAERMINDLVACEHGYVNLDHPRFMSPKKAIGEAMEEQALRRAPGANGVPADPSAMHGSASKPALAQQGNAMLPGLKGLDLNPKPGPALHGESTSGGAGPAETSGTWFNTLFSRPDGQKNAESSSSGAGEPSTAPAFALHTNPRGSVEAKPSKSDDLVLVSVIRKLVSSYFDIVRANLQDSVPKAVMHFLVNHTKEGLQNHLITQLYKEELFDEIMHERDDYVAKRAAAKAALAALQEARGHLELIPAELTRHVGTAEAERMENLNSTNDFSLNAFSPVRRRAQAAALSSQSMHIAARMATQAVDDANGLKTVDEVFGFQP